MKSAYRFKPLDFLFYSNLYIAFAAYMQVQQYAFLHDQHDQWFSASACIAFLGTWCIYSAHRLEKFVGKSSMLSSARIREISLHGKDLAFMTAISAIGCLWFFMRLKWATQGLVLVFGILAFAYGIPLWSGKRPIRSLSYLKTLLVALVWAAVVVLIPASEQGQLNTSDTLLWFFERLLFVFAITIPFDIRDAKLDQMQSIRTLPNLLGTKWAIRLAFMAVCLSSLGLLWFACLPSPIQSVQNGLPACLITNLLAGICIHFSSPDRHEYFYTGIVDGLLILQPFIVYFTYSVSN